MIFVKNNDSIEIIFDSLKSLLIRLLLQNKISIQRLKVKKNCYYLVVTGSKIKSIYFNIFAWIGFWYRSGHGPVQIGRSNDEGCGKVKSYYGKIVEWNIGENSGLLLSVKSKRNWYFWSCQYWWLHQRWEHIENV